MRRIPFEELNVDLVGKTLLSLSHEGEAPASRSGEQEPPEPVTIEAVALVYPYILDGQGKVVHEPVAELADGHRSQGIENRSGVPYTTPTFDPAKPPVAVAIAWGAPLAVQYGIGPGGWIEVEE